MEQIENKILPPMPRNPQRTPQTRGNASKKSLCVNEKEGKLTNNSINNNFDIFIVPVIFIFTIKIHYIFWKVVKV
jgi:hypothetical protein